MRTVFSTEGLPGQTCFRRWREVIHDRLVPVEQKKLGDGSFQGRIEASDVGSLAISRVTQSALRTEATTETVRRHAKHDTVSVIVKTAGLSTVTQDGRHSVQRPGDIVVVDRRPAVLASSDGSQSYLLEVPRQRLETALGDPRRYAAVTMDGGAPGASVARTYLQELVRVGEALSPDMAQRMASIGIDLIIASLAEGLARDVPDDQRGHATVQRAKAYVETHLGEPSLDPAGLAAAMGVSLRRLQELFHARGRCVSEWIWERRLATAAERLADPAWAHVAIGAVSYHCGFASQAHFSRRFREQFGLPPSEFRRQRLTR
jgi:AraC-like DNA-binding protein